MSNQNPNNPARRRIAGERRPPTAQPSTHGGEPSSPEPAPAEARADSPMVKPANTPTRDEPGQSRGPSGFVLAGLALFAAVAVGLAAYFSVQSSEADATADAQTGAPAAAEQAAQAILSYNYQTLEADKDKAARFLTDKYRAEYVDTFALVEENAPALKADVQAQVVASSVTRAAPDQVDALVFVNQTTTSTAKNGEPQTALNRVVLDMLKVDGTWLVDNITSY